MVFRSQQDGYTQFRIPVLATAPGKGHGSADLVLAFAEARGLNGTSAADSGNVRIVLRRSTDSGASFGPLLDVALNDWPAGCPHIHTVPSPCTFVSDAVPLWDALEKQMRAEKE